MEIKARKKKILEAIIRDYINTAEPVGSRTLSKRYDLGISPATIRNEMSDLEDMGYLIQPHTSSGRIPTQKAYRYYVDEIMQIQKLAKVLRDDIHKGYLGFSGEIDNTMQHTANVLSTLTNYTSVVLSPRVSRFNCKHVQIIPLIHERILMIVVTVEGVAKNIEMNLSREIDNAEALKLSNVLNSILKNIAFQEMGPDLIDDIQELTNEETGLLQEILPVLKDELLSEASEIHAGGLTNLLSYPEFNDTDRVKNLVSIIEEKPLLANVVASGSDTNKTIRVTIGNENDRENLKEFSIIATTYEVAGQTLGAFGLIGPTRMNYEKAGSVLDCIRSELNSNIKKLLE
jgi:heat-inducible transcriptional repressor